MLIDKISGIFVKNKNISMQHYVFEGVVKAIFDTQEFKKSFKKREIVVSSDEEYPQDIKFEFTDENGINKLDVISEGERVKIAFQLKGSEWQGKFFTNLRAMAISTFEEEQNFEAKQTKDVKLAAKLPKITPITQFDDSDDDLPF